MTTALFGTAPRALRVSVKSSVCNGAGSGGGGSPSLRGVFSSFGTVARTVYLPAAAAPAAGVMTRYDASPSFFNSTLNASAFFAVPSCVTCRTLGCVAGGCRGSTSTGIFTPVSSITRVVTPMFVSASTYSGFVWAAATAATLAQITHACTKRRIRSPLVLLSISRY
jgi:hypothetical protein